MKLKITFFSTLTILVTICHFFFFTGDAWSGSGMPAVLAASKTDKNKIELPNPLTPEAIDALLAKMSDDQVRRLLIDQLKIQANQEAEDESRAKQTLNIDDQAIKLKDRINFMASGLGKMEVASEKLYSRLHNNVGFKGILLLCLHLAVVLFACYLVETLFFKRVKPLKERLESKFDEKSLSKSWRFGLHAFLELMRLVIFFLASFAILTIFPAGTEAGHTLICGIVVIVICARLAILISNIIFSPGSAALRVVKISDDAARSFNKSFSVMLAIGLVSTLLSKLLYSLGIREEIYLLLRVSSTLLLAVILISFIWVYRKKVAEWLLNRTGGGKAQTAKALLVGLWHFLAIILIVIATGFWCVSFLMDGTEVGLFMQIAAVVFLYFFLSWVGDSILRRFYHIQDAETERSASEEEQEKSTESPSILETAGEPENGDEIDEEAEKTPDPNRFYYIIKKFMKLFIFIALAGLLLEWWDVVLPFSVAVTNAIFDIFVTLVLAALIWEFTKSAIEKRLLKEHSHAEGVAGEHEEGATLAKTRAATLLPLFRKFIGVVIVITTTLIILSSIGVEIVPLLASAGVVGLAVGLGSQTLVKDIVSGIFFILDDVFRQGDWCKIGGAEGGVANIGIRTLTLRHYKGMVEIIPYGDIKGVTNYSRGPMLVKFSLHLPADTNPDIVRKIVKKVNQEMMSEPEFGPNLVSKIKSQGVKSVEDSVMNIRVKFTAMPGTQFTIRREAYRRIHARLLEKGINFASRGVTVIAPPATTGGGKAEPARSPQAADKGDQPGQTHSPDLKSAAPSPADQPQEEGKPKASPAEDERQSAEYLHAAAAAAAAALAANQQPKKKE